MKQDICSLTIGEKRIFTFMTQALGLMADLDLGTSSSLVYCREASHRQTIHIVNFRHGTSTMDGRPSLCRRFSSGR